MVRCRRCRQGLRACCEAVLCPSAGRNFDGGGAFAPLPGSATPSKEDACALESLRAPARLAVPTIHSSRSSGASTAARPRLREGGTAAELLHIIRWAACEPGKLQNKNGKKPKEGFMQTACRKAARARYRRLKATAAAASCAYGASLAIAPCTTLPGCSSCGGGSTSGSSSSPEPVTR